MIFNSAPSNSIYFIVPPNTLGSNPESFIAVDRNVQESNSIRVLEYKQDSTPTRQVRGDGINVKEVEISFNICCSSYTELNLIIQFFKSKKGVLPITIYNTLNNVNRSIAIESWSVNLRNSLYGDISARGKLCY